MKRFLVILTVCAALFGCAPTSGVVVEKRYDDADTWTTFEPVYASRCSGIGDKMRCITVQTGSIPVQHYDPEHWSLKLDDGEDRGWTDVDERTWHEVAVGQTYNRKTGEIS